MGEYVNIYGNQFFKLNLKKKRKYSESDSKSLRVCSESKLSRNISKIKVRVGRGRE